MTELQYDSSTPRFALPLLFSAQAQKEFYINESLARLDALSHPAIEAITALPPAAALDGQMWLVATGAGGEWEGYADRLAARVGGQWLIVGPQDGMRVFNKATGQIICYNGAWNAPQVPALPSGGNTVDVQAREAIAALQNCLVEAGILPSS